jgi:ethanolamine utilization protein EutN
MKLGRVIGTMVSNTRAEGMEGLKLLIVRPLNSRLEPDGPPFVATDASDQAGPDDLITWEGSREAALLHAPERFIPVDHGIVGIVDEYTYRKRGEAT